MASVLSNYLGNRMLTANFTGTLWLALHVDDPTPSALPGTELFGAGYERQAITFDPTPSGKTTTSTNNQTFDSLPSAIIEFLAVWTARVNGNLLATIDLTPAIAVSASSQFLCAAGDIAISL